VRTSGYVANLESCPDSTVTGLPGVVAAAKGAGLIDLGKPLIDDLIQNARFWIGAELYIEVLKELGEA
jgi:predicted nucleic acid-binding protein